jgi:hypothetical protein
MKSFFAILPFALFFVLAPAEHAFAIQTHGAPEGLYAHQLAHLFFILCMGSFAYRIRRSSLPKNQGWQLIVLGSILLIAWNLWAFTGHGDLWRNLSPFSGNINTMSFVVIGAITLFSARRKHLLPANQMPYPARGYSTARNKKIAPSSPSGKSIFTVSDIVVQ